MSPCNQLINAKWYLILDVKYTLLIGHTYLIGRKDCDVLLSGDTAVSRKHAQIELVHPETNIVSYTCFISRPFAHSLFVSKIIRFYAF